MLEQLTHQKKTKMKETFKIVFFFLLVSCASNTNVSTNKTMEFTNNEVKEIINTIESDSNFKTDNDLYYHFKYQTFLNDTTNIIDIVANTKLPSIDDKVTGVLKYDTKFIFIYDSREKLSDATLNSLKKDRLILEKSSKPFFIVDSPYWNLYIEKDSQDLIIKRMKPILKIDKSTKGNSIDF